MSTLSVGALASIAYSRGGRTIAQYSGINVVLDSSQKDLRTMKSNRLAVFAASLQCTEEVQVVPRETPQVPDVGDLRKLVVGVCRGERRRKGREVPNSEV